VEVKLKYCTTQQDTAGTVRRLGIFLSFSLLLTEALFLPAWKWPNKAETSEKELYIQGKKYEEAWKNSELLPPPVAAGRHPEILHCPADLLRHMNRGRSQSRSHSLRDSQGHLGFCSKPLPQS